MVQVVQVVQVVEVVVVVEGEDVAIGMKGHPLSIVHYSICLIPPLRWQNAVSLLRNVL